MSGSPPKLVENGKPVPPRQKIKEACHKWAEEQGKNIKDPKAKKDQFFKDYSTCMMKNGENPRD